MSPLRSFFSRVLVVLLLFGVTAGSASAASSKPLKVVFVSGAETYNTDQGFADLAGHLWREYRMDCEVLRMSPDQKEIIGIERLLQADTAIFHVRRKTLNEQNLAILKKFFASGKGFIALRSTSHGWENWREFDQEVLGAKYSGNFGIATKLTIKDHPIWRGVEGLETKKDLYRITEVGPDVTVILEGETKNGTVPVGWTRPHHQSRLFYLALGYQQDMEQPAFRKMMVNAIHWVTAPAAPAPKAAAPQR